MSEIEILKNVEKEIEKLIYIKSRIERLKEILRISNYDIECVLDGLDGIRNLYCYNVKIVELSNSGRIFVHFRCLPINMFIDFEDLNKKIVIDDKSEFIRFIRELIYIIRGKVYSEIEKEYGKIVEKIVVTIKSILNIEFTEILNKIRKLDEENEKEIIEELNEYSKKLIDLMNDIDMCKSLDCVMNILNNAIDTAIDFYY